MHVRTWALINEASYYLLLRDDVSPRVRNSPLGGELLRALGLAVRFQVIPKGAYTKRCILPQH